MIEPQIAGKQHRKKNASRILLTPLCSLLPVGYNKKRQQKREDFWCPPTLRRSSFWRLFSRLQAWLSLLLSLFKRKRRRKRKGRREEEGCRSLEDDGTPQICTLAHPFSQFPFLSLFSCLSFSWFQSYPTIKRLTFFCSDDELSYCSCRTDCLFKQQCDFLYNLFCPSSMPFYLCKEVPDKEEKQIWGLKSEQAIASWLWCP